MKNTFLLAVGLILLAVAVILSVQHMAWIEQRLEQLQQENVELRIRVSDLTVCVIELQNATTNRVSTNESKEPEVYAYGEQLYARR